MKKLSAYLLEVAFVALLVRTLAVGCGIGEALALISIVSSIVYREYMTKGIIQDRVELEARLEKALEEVNKKLDDTSNKVNSLSMNQSMKRTTTNEQKTISELEPGKRYF